MKFEPVAHVVKRLGLGKEAHDYPERLGHHLPQTAGVEPKHQRIGKMPAGSDAEVDAPPGQVVKQDDPIGDNERMVVRQADRSRPEADVPGPLSSHREKEFWAGDWLPAAAVVFADPHFVVAERVEPLDEFEVSMERQRRVVVRRVKRGHEGAEAHRCWLWWHRTTPVRIGRPRSG